MNPAYIVLPLAILAEVIGTCALKSSNSFSKLLPTIFTFIGYGISFYLLSVALKTLPVGITYAIWAGIGIVAMSIISVLIYKQSFDLAGILGVLLILTGVIVINIFSNVEIH